MPVYKDGIWHCMYQEKRYLLLHHMILIFPLSVHGMSPSYGIKIDTTCLRAKTLVTDQPLKLLFNNTGMLLSLFFKNITSF